MAAASVGVTAEPELMVIANLSPADRILVIASDGIWDRINNEEVMTTIATKFYPSRDAEGACTFLVKTAAERWQSEQGMVDDITIVIAFLNVGRV
jgi:serine/threonine protein phosphatase PrpC